MMNQLLSTTSKLVLNTNFNCFFIFIIEDEHLAYVYLLGVYEGHCYKVRHNLESSCSEDIIIKPDCLPISPWWRKESKLRHQELQKWPPKPTQLVCKRVHAFSDSAPWCTYLLTHPLTVPSSALSIEDNSVEFKMAMGQDPSGNIPQAISNMVRAASNLLVDAIIRGKIIHSVIVYGLLVSYDKSKCVPLKYTIDFEANDTTISIGEQDAFSRLFSFVVVFAL